MGLKAIAGAEFEIAAGWHGQGGIGWLAQTECTLQFIFVAMVAGTVCCLVCCFQKVLSIHVCVGKDNAFQEAS